MTTSRTRKVSTVKRDCWRRFRQAPAPRLQTSSRGCWKTCGYSPQARNSRMTSPSLPRAMRRRQTDALADALFHAQALGNLLFDLADIARGRLFVVLRGAEGVVPLTL